MDRLERMRLLFENDLSLLTSDAGLRKPSEEPVNKSTQQTGAATIQRNPQAAAIKISQEDQKIESDDIVSIDDLGAVTRNAGVVENAWTILGAVEPKLAGGEKSWDSPDTQPLLSGNKTSIDLLSQCFCPVMAIARLPYKFIRGEQTEFIADHFFDRGQFWQRPWDLYYIIPPEDISPNPLLLVPATQVDQFLDEINHLLGCRLSLPIGPDIGLVLSFEEDGTPQPQFLGQCTSRYAKDQLEMGIAKPLVELGDENDQNVNSLNKNDSFAAFRRKIEAGVEATKKKSKASREKKRQEKIERQREWTRSLKRTQCYLGLRPRHPQGLCRAPLDENATEEEIRAAEREYGLACGTLLRPLQLQEPAPFPFADEPIFISVDIESNERCHDQITEIGVSTLDTLDLVGIVPGEGGKNWIGLTRSRHFRIKEMASVQNHDFISGCPDRFNFGESEWVMLKDAAKMVDGCFQPPYSAQIPIKIKAVQRDGRKADVVIEDAINEHKLCSRKIVLVGHDINADISYLRNLGCTLFDNQARVTTRKGSLVTTNQPPKFLEALDTATLFQVLKRDQYPRSLGVILNDLELIGWNLHNAGNDARYTLEAMIRIILTSRSVDDGDAHQPETGLAYWPLGLTQGAKDYLDKHAGATATAHDAAWKQEVERRVAETVADSEQRIRDECKIWEIATGWDGNGTVNDDIDGGVGGGIKIRNARYDKKVKHDKGKTRSTRYSLSSSRDGEMK